MNLEVQASLRCYCQLMRQLIASDTVNKQRLPQSRRARLQPCMFGCSAGYILLMLSSLAIYLNFITILYGANEAWIHRPSTSAKKLADLSQR